jgi:hypothetical protein
MVMNSEHSKRPGVVVPNGCRVTHGTAASIKTPFTFAPVTMHELDPGVGGRTYRGQFGFIPFQADFRMPRHIHIEECEGPEARLVAERILVVGGVALTELNGAIHVVAPGTLVEISPGVPHTWTGCPPGVQLPDGSVSDGQFLMIYEYSEPTAFHPTASTDPISSVSEYRPFNGDLKAIRFPQLDARQIADSATLVWNDQIVTNLRVAN